MTKTYELVLRIPIEGIDDISARDAARVRLASLFPLPILPKGWDCKLREIYPNKAPRNIKFLPS